VTLNEEKKKKLVELLAKRRVATGVGTSTPTNPPPLATSAPNSSVPTPVDSSLKGVVVAIGTEDEDTSSGPVFKRQRVDDVVVPSHSASDGHAPSFRDHPPNASFPLLVISSYTKVGGERS